MTNQLSKKERKKTCGERVFVFRPPPPSKNNASGKQRVVHEYYIYYLIEGSLIGHEGPAAFEF